MTPVPIACTVTAESQTSQLHEWDSLMRDAVATRRLLDGMRVVLPSARFVEAASLVGREQRCCAWATWSAELSDDGVVIEVRSDQREGAAAIHLMFESLVGRPRADHESPAAL